MSYRLLKCTSPFVNAMQTIAWATKVHKPAFIARTLYSSTNLGINGFVEMRAKSFAVLSETDGSLRERLVECVDGPDTSANMVFTTDLKSWLHLTTNSSEDIALTLKLIQKYYTQDSIDAGYQFGPVVLRLFHIFKLDQDALRCFNEPTLKKLFTQNSSFLILLDLLYKAERYQDVIDTFESVKSLDSQRDGKLSRNLIVLPFAAAYKLNTPVSLQYSINLTKKLRSQCIEPSRRSDTFLACLALAQNAPNIALEIMSSKKEQSYVTVRNIKALALTRLKRYDDALQVLQSVTTMQVGENKATFTKDIIDTIRTEVQHCGSNDVVAKFEQIEELLVTTGHVVANETLDSLICKEINYEYSSHGKDGAPNSGSYREHRKQRFSPNKEFKNRLG